MKTFFFALLLILGEKWDEISVKTFFYFYFLLFTWFWAKNGTKFECDNFKFWSMFLSNFLKFLAPPFQNPAYTTGYDLILKPPSNQLLVSVALRVSNTAILLMLRHHLISGSHKNRRKITYFIVANDVSHLKGHGLVNREPVCGGRYEDLFQLQLPWVEYRNE